MNEAMHKIMVEAWHQWHGGVDPDLVPRPNPSFEKGFKVACEHYESIIKRLECDNIECHYDRDVLKSIWEAIHQTPACGLNAILCAAAQEIYALRSMPKDKYDNSEAPTKTEE